MCQYEIMHNTDILTGMKARQALFTVDTNMQWQIQLIIVKHNEY